jgi:hypothetical protein
MLLHISSRDRVTTDINRLVGSELRTDADPVEFTRGSDEVCITTSEEHGLEPEDMIVVENATLGAARFDDALFRLSDPFMLIDVPDEHLAVLQGAAAEAVTMTVRTSGYLVFGSIDPATLVSVPIDPSVLVNDRYLRIHLAYISVLVDRPEELAVDFAVGGSVVISDRFVCSLHACHLQAEIQLENRGVEQLRLCFVTNSETVIDALRIEVLENRDYPRLTTSRHALFPTSVLDTRSIQWAPTRRSVKVLFTAMHGVSVAHINANLPIDESHASGFHVVTRTAPRKVYFRCQSGSTADWRAGGDRLLVHKIGSQELALPNNRYYANTYRTFHDVKSVRVTSSFFPHAIKTVCREYGTDVLDFSDEWGASFAVKLPEYVYDLRLVLEELKRGLDATAISLAGGSSSSTFFMTFDTTGSFFELRLFARTVLSMPFYMITNYDTGDRIPRRVRISFENHGVYSSGSEIVLENCLSFAGIPESALNKTHALAVVDRDTLEIIIPGSTNFSPSLDNDTRGGGQAVVAMIRKKVRFRETNELRKLLRLPAAMSDTFKNTSPVRLYPDYFFVTASFNNGKIVSGNQFTTRSGAMNVITKVQIPEVTAQ